VIREKQLMWNEVFAGSMPEDGALTADDKEAFRVYLACGPG
jgi:hypothetical protein